MVVSSTTIFSSAITVQYFYTKTTDISLGKTYKDTIKYDYDSDEDENYKFYEFWIPTAQKVRIYIDNYKVLKDNATFFYLFESDDIIDSVYRSYYYIADQFLEHYNIYEYENPSAYSFNLYHDIKTTADGKGYIDKFLPEGTYYLGIEYLGIGSISYSVKVSDMPKSDLKKSAKKAMKKAKIKKFKVKNRAYNKITVTWKKVDDAKGYQVQASKNKKFKKIVSKKSTSQSWLSIDKYKKLTIKNLKRGTKYYMRVRAYATYKDVYGNKKKLYGPWSKILKTATKK